MLARDHAPVREVNLDALDQAPPERTGGPVPLDSRLRS